MLVSLISFSFSTDKTWFSSTSSSFACSKLSICDSNCARAEKGVTFLFVTQSFLELFAHAFGNSIKRSSQNNIQFTTNNFCHALPILYNRGKPQTYMIESQQNTDTPQPTIPCNLRLHLQSPPPPPASSSPTTAPRHEALIYPLPPKSVRIPLEIVCYLS